MTCEDKALTDLAAMSELMRQHEVDTHHTGGQWECTYKKDGVLYCVKDRHVSVALSKVMKALRAGVKG